jgi:hypothetical protein
MSFGPRIKTTWLIGLLMILLAGCSAPAALPTPSATTAVTVSPTPLPTSTSTPTLTPTPVRTPPALPGPYQTSLLNPLDLPHAYIQEPCQYLHDKWSSTNSAPGTVVMVIMFHSVTNDAVTSPSQISEYDFRQLMNRLHDDGFQAITALQLADFMEKNARIPPRSVLLVVDDRKSSDYFNILFRQYWEQYGWPVVNAWISAFGGGDPVLAGNVALSEEGWVDYQAHGASSPHIAIDPSSTDAFIRHDLQGSMDNIQKYFGKAPIAYIWPGGGFTPHAVQIARQLGYRLGFTTNPRGPLMYNWASLTDAFDDRRPSWLAEGPVNDPLLVLPRYWDTDAIIHLDEVTQISQEAAAYAEQNKATELEYYDIVCSPTYGPIP